MANISLGDAMHNRQSSASTGICFGIGWHPFAKALHCWHCSGIAFADELIFSMHSGIHWHSLIGTTLAFHAYIGSELVINQKINDSLKIDSPNRQISVSFELNSDSNGISSADSTECYELMNTCLNDFTVRTDFNESSLETPIANWLRRQSKAIEGNLSPKIIAKYYYNENSV